MFPQVFSVPIITVIGDEDVIREQPLEGRWPRGIGQNPPEALQARVE